MEKKVRQSRDQQNCAADLRRNGQGSTADRVEALSSIGFEQFKRNLLARYAADGKFE